MDFSRTFVDDKRSHKAMVGTIMQICLVHQTGLGAAQWRGLH